ncbi:unnamed protein product [Auanema sp. JU1783]|nr:unnamed protein product [Auanema sp. JU1783]
MKFVIIGSGPTSLGAAYRLHELICEKTIPAVTQVHIVEKEHEAGGLARSVTDENGFTWDLGVHITGASKYAKFLQVINDNVPEWRMIPRCVYMEHVMQDNLNENNYIPYPVQESIPYFPIEVKSICLEEIRQSKLDFAANFGELTQNVFGETLQNIFIRPYNEKVWTIPLEEMNCVWVENRVPQPNVSEIERRCSLTYEQLEEEEQQKPPICFKYPARMKGMGELWKTVASQLPNDWLLFNAPVEEIDVTNKKVKAFGEHTFEYDFLISTIPLTELCKLTNLCPDIELKHSQVALVGIGFRKPQPSFTKNLSWLYFPQKDIPFYRCTFISNFNDLMTPNSDEFWSVICEVGLQSQSAVDENSIVQSTIQGLKVCGIADENMEIVSKWFYLLPYGYPIPSLNRDKELDKAHKQLEKHQIYSRGRFGGWKYEYANQDHSFMIGYEVIDRILFDKSEQLHK